MNTIVNEQKLDFADFISEGLKIFFFRIKDFSLLALGPVIPISLLLVVALSGLPSQDAETDVVKIILLCLFFLLQVVISLITSMSSKIIIESIVENKPVSLADAIKSASSRWGRALTTQLLTSLIILALSLLLVIPGIIYSIGVGA